MSVELVLLVFFAVPVVIAGLSMLGERKVSKQIAEVKRLPSADETDWAEYERYAQNALASGQEPDIREFERQRKAVRLSCSQGGDHDPVTIRHVGIVCTDCRFVFCSRCDGWHMLGVHERARSLEAGSG